MAEPAARAATIIRKVFGSKIHFIVCGLAATNDLATMIALLSMWLYQITTSKSMIEALNDFLDCLVAVALVRVVLLAVGAPTATAPADP